MRIAISSHPHAGGSGIVASGVAMALAERGHDVHLVACRRPLRLDESSAVTFHPFDVNDYPLFRSPPHDLCLTNKLAEVVRDHRVDIIHAHYAIPHAVAALLAKQISRCVDCRVVTTLHGTDVTLVGSHPSFFQLTQHAMEQSDGITAVSQWLARKTREFFDLQKPIQVIPNFIDPAHFHPAGRVPYPEDGPFELLHISNFRPVKRITDIIRAFDIVQRELPARLTLTGDGPELGPARELIGELGLNDSVSIKPITSTLPPIYRASHLFLLLSDYESFGVSALEAMACGTPVIASNSGGLPEVITSGENGCLCAPGDFRAAARLALDVLGNRARWEAMSRRAADMSKDTFCTDRIIPHYETFYQDVLDG